MSVTSSDQVLTLVKDLGIARSRDLKARGIHPQQLSRLVAVGALVQVSWGLYALPTADLTEFQTYVEACARFPRGTLCLLSALVINGVKTLAKGLPAFWTTVALMSIWHFSMLVCLVMTA